MKIPNPVPSIARFLRSLVNSRASSPSDPTMDDLFIERARELDTLFDDSPSTPPAGYNVETEPTLERDTEVDSLFDDSPSMPNTRNNIETESASSIPNLHNSNPPELPTLNLIDTDRVFNITELSEAIFIHLPIRKLLVIQRVCKQWRSVINGSSRLQQALFLQPVPGPSLHQRGRNRGTSVWAPQDDDPNSHSVLTNPFQVKIHSVHYDMPPFNYPEASWRRMLVSQPPVRVVTVVTSWQCAPDTIIYFDSPRLSPVRHERFRYEFNALTYGDIENVAKSIGVNRLQYHVTGSSHWRTGTDCPEEVRRVVRPNAMSLDLSTPINEDVAV